MSARRIRDYSARIIPDSLEDYPEITISHRVDEVDNVIPDAGPDFRIKGTPILELVTEEDNKLRSEETSTTFTVSKVNGRIVLTMDEQADRTALSVSVKISLIHKNKNGERVKEVLPREFIILPSGGKIQIPFYYTDLTTLEPIELYVLEKKEIK